MSLAIEINELHKHYPGSWSPALDGLSLNVKENRITGLLGPNGAGKTTTINILCGLVHPDSGSARVFGVDCVEHTNAVRSQVGVVPQQIALFPNLTAWENFFYIGRLYGISRDYIKSRSAQLLQRLDLEKHAEKRIQSFSGGMKRRANIIASLLHYPQILILDEPTAGVDVQSRAMILDFIQEYKQEGKTVLYTSHLLDEAEKICDDVVIIDEGKFIIEGTPQALIHDTNDCTDLEDVFLHYTGHSVRD
ncbi:MAG TPA: ABC transporter ATP-binding protein [Flavipsychrobacter sp.]